MNEFFSNVEAAYTRMGDRLCGSNVYNLDETGLSNVEALPKILAEKGVKQFLKPRLPNMGFWILDGKVAFMQALTHFQKFTKCSKENPIVLIIDNHERHFSTEILEFVTANEIHVVTLTPHTHRIKCNLLIELSSNR